MASIKNKIAKFPKSPGVYQFVDDAGGILYVGKAKNLNSRIKSYFLKEIGRGPTIDQMVAQAFDVKFFETESEIEAVILEAELVKKLKPKYNIKLKDDKSFLVIKITKPTVATSMFPCVELIRFKNADLADKSAEYFGPYPSGLLLKKSINYLRKIFPFRDCSKTKFATYRKKGRPCIYGDIRVCTAPCVGWVDEKQYEQNIIYLKKFLCGQKKEIYKNLTAKMNNLSREKRFEEAALVRNQLQALNHLKEVPIGLRDDVFSSENSMFKRIECYDISNIFGLYGVGAMVVFENGKKNTDEYRKFKIKFSQTPNDLMMLKEILERRFKNDWSLPDLIVVDGGENQLKVAQKIIAKNNFKIPAVGISKGPKRDKNEFHFSDPAVAKYLLKNYQLKNIIISARDESHRFAINYYRELHKKGMFE